MMSEIKYRPDLDGLRAVAILLVLFFHAGLGVKGGYIGVDVFFVISGYLITKIIVQDLEDGTFSFLRFWQRRAQRILPALLFVTFSTIITCGVLFLPNDFISVAKQVLSQVLFSSNIYFFTTSGYFATDSATKPMLHTWSLAVEEQFYLLFPLLIFLLFAKARRWAIYIVLCITVVSLLLSIYAVINYRQAAFFLPQFRAWELMAGGLLAMYGKGCRLKPVVYEGISASGILAILLPAIFFYTSKTAFPGMAAFPPCLGAVAIIYSNSHYKTYVGKILSLRPIVFIGLISYSLYLWHWPIICFFEYLLQDDYSKSDKIICLILSCFMGALSGVTLRVLFGGILLLSIRNWLFLPPLR